MTPVSSEVHTRPFEAAQTSEEDVDMEGEKGTDNENDTEGECLAGAKTPSNEGLSEDDAFLSSDEDKAEHASFDEFDFDSSKGDYIEADCTVKEVEKLSADDRIARAMSCKDSGNQKLKESDTDGARKFYMRGLCFVDDLTAVQAGDSNQAASDTRKALRLNLALICVKAMRWMAAVRHADKALKEEPGNVKALYRRGLGRRHAGCLEEAKADFTDVCRREPTNADARRELQAVKAALEEHQKKDKERFSGLFSKSALYADKAEEAAIREKEKKEAEEKRRQQWAEENKQRTARGEEEITYEDWDEQKKKAEEEERKKREEKDKKDKKENGSKSNEGNKSKQSAKEDDDFLDEEDRKIIEETKKMGYCYFNRPKDEAVLRSAPQQVGTAETANGNSTATNTSPVLTEEGRSISSWNAKGTTYEEKDTTTAAKASFEKRLKEVEARSGGITSLRGPESADRLQEIVSLIGNAKDPAEQSKKLQDAAASLIPIRMKTTGVKSVEGEAHMAVVRGTKRFLYDFHCTLEWQVDVKDPMEVPPEKEVEGEMKKIGRKRYKGELKLEDVSSASPIASNGQKEWIANAKVVYKESVKPQHQAAVDSILVKFKEALDRKITQFESEFKEKC